MKTTDRKYIVVCTYSVDGDGGTSRVKYNGKSTFSSYDEALKALEADMEEYVEAERVAGFGVKTAGMHLEWEDDYIDREAKWSIQKI